MSQHLGQVEGYMRVLAGGRSIFMRWDSAMKPLPHILCVGKLNPAGYAPEY